MEVVVVCLKGLSRWQLGLASVRIASPSQDTNRISPEYMPRGTAISTYKNHNGGSKDLWNVGKFLPD
jgi:hypothetical protein